MSGLRGNLGVVVFSAVVTALFFLPVHTAHAHARWKPDSAVLKPRSNSDGLKTGPCGAVARTTTPAQFTPGQMVEVEWEETINHPGFYRIAFSLAGDTGFDSAVLYSAADTLGTETALPHRYKATITLPMQTCESCTLQLIQVMTDRTPPSNYYSCADIKIAATSGGDPVPAPAPVPTPTPTPTIPTDMKVFAQQLLDDFAAADTNMDGALAITEIQSIYPALTPSQFNIFDTTRDGLLSVKDIEGYIAPPPATSPAGSAPPKNSPATTPKQTTAAASIDGWIMAMLIPALLGRRRRRA